MRFSNKIGTGEKFKNPSSASWRAKAAVGLLAVGTLLPVGYYASKSGSECEITVNGKATDRESVQGTVGSVVMKQGLGSKVVAWEPSSGGSGMPLDGDSTVEFLDGTIVGFSGDC